MNFIEDLQAAELHWHFVQASQALRAELYIPAVITYLTAIENSIRSTLSQISSNTYPENNELGATLSNRLLRDAKVAGMPISLLAMNGENIIEGIVSNKPNVGVVEIRHNLCHGNIHPYINRELDIFTPECVRELAHTLEEIAVKWSKGLSEFRSSKQSNV